MSQCWSKHVAAFVKASSLLVFLQFKKELEKLCLVKITSDASDLAFIHILCSECSGSR